MKESDLNEFFIFYKQVIQGKHVEKKFQFYGNDFLKNPYIWGNVYWNVLHNLAYKIDSLKIEKNLKFTLLFLSILKNLYTILPCDTCANSYSYTFECASKLKLFYEKYEFSHSSEMLQKLMYYLHTCVNIKKIGAQNDEDTLTLFMNEINEQESFFQTFHRLFPNNGFLFYDQSKKIRKPINVYAFLYFYNTFYKEENQEFKNILKIIKKIY
jgi:hypothetical protein